MFLFICSLDEIVVGKPNPTTKKFLFNFRQDDEHGSFKTESNMDIMYVYILVYVSEHYVRTNKSM